MSYREDNLTPMNSTQSNRSHAVQTDRRNTPQGPYEPWYRSGTPWMLLVIVVVTTGISWPSLTRGPGSVDFWLWSLVLVLVVAFAVVQFRAWWLRGRKRTGGRA